MKNYKTMQELDLGYSKSQLYRRVDKLVDEGLIDPERGSRNQFLFPPEDVEVLRRLADLEERYDGIKTAIVQLENEQLREEIDELEGKKETLENELVARNNIIKRIRKDWREKIRDSFRTVVDWFKK